MNIELEKRIENFIEELKKSESDSFKIEYNYDENLEVYEILHNNRELNYNKEKRVFLRSLFKKHLKGVFNISFGYDYERFPIVETSKCLKKEENLDEVDCNKWLELISERAKAKNSNLFVNRRFKIEQKNKVLDQVEDILKAISYEYVFNKEDDNKIESGQKIYINNAFDWENETCENEKISSLMLNIC
jgi:hypothetical protein